MFTRLRSAPVERTSKEHVKDKENAPLKTSRQGSGGLPTNRFGFKPSKAVVPPTKDMADTQVIYSMPILFEKGFRFRASTKAQ